MSQLTRFTAASGPGSGTVTSVSGGTGINITGVPTVNPTVNLDVPVVIANGGTNAIAFATVDGTVYYDGTRLVTTATGNAGDILTSNGAGVAPSYQPSVADGIITAAGDTGAGATGATVTWDANTNSGATVLFDAAAATVSLKVTDASANTIIGLSAGNGTLSGSGNTSLGEQTLTGLTTGLENTTLGFSSGNALTTGDFNTLIGFNAGVDIITGDGNIVLGHEAALNYTGAEASNIIIGNAGTVADSGKIRIGTNAVHTATHIAGIDGVNIGSVAEVLTMSAAVDQIGTATITAGTGVTITPGANTITIDAAGAVALSFPTDSGTATPAAGSLTVAGGLNLTTTGAGSTVTVAEKTFRLLNNYSVANASPYVVAATEYYITVDTSTIPITIQLPNAPTAYQVFIIKDSAGNAATNNITVTTVAGLINIDAATTYVMNTNWASIQVVYDTFGYQVF